MKLEEQLIRLNEEEIFGKIHSVDIEEFIELHALNGAVTDKKIFVSAFSLSMQLVLQSKIKI